MRNLLIYILIFFSLVTQAATEGVELGGISFQSKVARNASIHFFDQVHNGPSRPLRRNPSICRRMASFLCGFFGSSRYEVISDETTEDSPYSRLESSFSQFHMRAEEDSPVRTSLARGVSYLVGGTGATVLGWMGSNFITDEFNAPLPVGITFGIISAIPPFLGFSSVIYPKVKKLLFWEPPPKNLIKPLRYYDVLREVGIGIPSLITTFPLVFVAYKSMNPVLGNISHIFEAATLLGFYLYYDKTTKGVLKEVFKKCKGTIRIARFGARSQQTSLRENRDATIKFDLLRDLTEVEELISNIPESEVDQLFDHVMEIRGKELSNILNLKRHFSYVDPIVEMSPSQTRRTKRPIIFASLGATIGIVGTYFFYVIGRNEITELMQKKFSEKTLSTLSAFVGVITFACRGSFNAYTSFSTWKNIYEKISDRVSPKKIISLSLALTGAIPSTKISLDYLKYLGEFGRITLSTTTGISIFSDGYWGMGLALENRGKRAFIVENVRALKSLIPSIKDVYMRDFYEEWGRHVVT